MKAAATALDEVIELDPNLPELPELTARFDESPAQGRGETHRGPRLAAAAVFAVIVLGASLLHDSTSLISRPMIAAAPLVSVSVPTPSVAVPPEAAAAGTTGDRETVAEPTVRRPSPEPAIAPCRVDPARSRRPPTDAPEV